MQRLRLADQRLCGQLRQRQGVLAVQKAGFLCQTQPVAGLQCGGAAGDYAVGGQLLHSGGIFLGGNGVDCRFRLRAGGHNAAGQHHDGGHAERCQLFQIHGYYLPIVFRFQGDRTPRALSYHRSFKKAT